MEKNAKSDVLEKLSALDHERWEDIRKGLFEELKDFGIDGIFLKKNGEPKARWRHAGKAWLKLRSSSYYGHYSSLPEEAKGHYRRWAVRTLEIVIKEAGIFEKELIEHPLLDKDQKETGSATIHDFVSHLEFALRVHRKLEGDRLSSTKDLEHR